MREGGRTDGREGEGNGEGRESESEGESNNRNFGIKCGCFCQIVYVKLYIIVEYFLLLNDEHL